MADSRDQLERAVTLARAAISRLNLTAQGDSNDAEIEAGRDVADAADYLAALVTEFLAEGRADD